MGRESKAKQERREAEQAIDADRPTAEPWNTRYLEYARAHERGPETMLEWDRQRFPGGKMAGFILWVGARWEEWRELRQLPKGTPIAQEHHADFDAWLKGWVDEKTRRLIVPRQAEIVRPG